MGCAVAIDGHCAVVADSSMRMQLKMTDSGAFTFLTPIEDLQSYHVSIAVDAMNPIQPCEVINGQGTVQGGDVDQVDVLCAEGNDLIFRHNFDTPHSTTSGSDL